MSVISDIKMILESNSIHLLYDARLCTEQKKRWDAIKDADLVEVVRCKDCRWWKSIFSWNGKEHKVCVRDASEPPREQNDFCSYAERREDDKG